MPDELLPPDPSKDGWYWWLRAPNGLVVPAQWRGYGWKVFGQPVAYGAQFMAEQGYSLASPHPIPGPEQLDALHALPSELLNWAHVSAQSEVFAISDSERARSCGIKDTLQTTAAMLRAALGAKPDDPPGKSI